MQTFIHSLLHVFSEYKCEPLINFRQYDRYWGEGHGRNPAWSLRKLNRVKHRIGRLGSMRTQGRWAQRSHGGVPLDPKQESKSTL